MSISGAESGVPAQAFSAVAGSTTSQSTSAPTITLFSESTTSLVFASLSNTAPPTVLSDTTSQAVTFPRFTATKSASSANTSAASHSTSPHSLSTGVKAGIGIVVALVVILLLVATVFVIGRHRRRQRMGNLGSPAFGALDDKPELEGSRFVEGLREKPELAAVTKAHIVDDYCRSVPELEAPPPVLHTRDPVPRNPVRTAVSEMPVRAQPTPGSISTESARRDPVELEESSESRNTTPSTPPPGGGGELETLRRKEQSLQESIDAMQALHRLQAEQAELQERIRLAEAKCRSAC